jgi:hypothetical protein
MRIQNCWLIPLVLLSAILPCLGQGAAELQSSLDAALKGLKSINFAHPIPADSWVQRLVPPDELNALALDVFARYKISIKPTPLEPTMIGTFQAYRLPAAPSLSFKIATREGSIKTADLKLELRDEAELKNRSLDRKLIVTI